MGELAQKRKDARIMVLVDILKTLGILVLFTALGAWMYSLGITEVNIILLYILCVLLTAMWTNGKKYSFISTFIGVIVFNFCFITPRFSLKAYGREYPVTFIIMFLVAFLMSTLTTRVKEQAAQAAEKAYRTEILLETSQKLQKAGGAVQIISSTAMQMRRLLGRTILFYLPDDNGKLVRRIFCVEEQNKEEYISSVEKETAEWVFKNNRPAGASAEVYEKACCWHLPVQGDAEVLAVCGIALEGERLTEFEKGLLVAMLRECALALEKQRLDDEKKEAEMKARQESLRADLLRAISHDLRTPLTGISGNASMLMNQSMQMEEEKRFKIYGDIYDDAMWLINLVENLLSVTRIENGTMSLTLQTELIDEVVCEAMHHLNRRAEAHKIVVNQEEEFLMAGMDARLVTQVFINMIDNAVKYTPDGSSILIHIFRQGEFIMTEIADDGPGIADEDKEQLFDMFYTADNQKGDGRRGLGLGLALCKAIVTAHGGVIGVRDNEPAGSVFYFTLPAEEVKMNE